MKCYFDGPFLKSAGPHKGRRHVDVSMGVIHSQIGSITAVAKYSVTDFNGTVVAEYVPLMWIRANNWQFVILTVNGLYIVDIFSKLMQRITAWRSAAHSELQWCGSHVGKNYRNLGLVVVSIIK